MRRVIIVGGGIAGLTCSILLQRAGFEVIVFEKKEYPFHRVCGEYISNETLSLLASMGVDPFENGASRISRLLLTSLSGTPLSCKLPLGGFGLSRYKFDQLLYQQALKEGVCFYFQKVVDARFLDGKFRIRAVSDHDADIFICSHGKRSNLDQKFSRDFFQKRSDFLGIKYHIRGDFNNDEIAIHHFPGGYAGLCKIEGGDFNLCYLTRSENLRSAGSIPEMERIILSQNIGLRNILQNSVRESHIPQVIHEISFAEKTLVENHTLFCGDSAGMITPICGNGMAIAMHSAKILSETVIEFGMSEQISFEALEKAYCARWNRIFKWRLKRGRWIQRLFEYPFFAELALNGLQRMPAISRSLIAGTHGKRI